MIEMVQTFVMKMVRLEGPTKPLGVVRILWVLILWSQLGVLFFHDHEVSLPAVATLGGLFLVGSTLMFLGWLTRLGTLMTAIAVCFICFWLDKRLLALPFLLSDLNLQLLLTSITFLFVLTPCGDSYSIDAWRDKEEQKKESSLWGTKLICLQISLIYFWLAFQKTSWMFLSGQKLESMLMASLFGSDYPTWPFFHEIIVLISVSLVVFEYALVFGLWSKKYQKGLFICSLMIHSIFYIPFYHYVFSCVMILCSIFYFDQGEVTRFLKGKSDQKNSWTEIISRAFYDVRTFGTNILVAVISIGLLIVILEGVFFGLLTKIPMKYQGHLDGPIRTLAQSSKQGTLPKNYIAILGDSYAEGWGDELLNADIDHNDPYGPFHYLHNKTGQDVISFGIAGTGSLTGYLTRPISFYEYLNQLVSTHLEPPSVLLAFFFEGNDLEDNLSDLKYRFHSSMDDFHNYESHELDEFINNKVLFGDPYYREAQKMNWRKNFLFLNFLDSYAKTTEREMKAIHPVPRYDKPSINQTKIKMNGKEESIPGNLFGPALELSKKEMDISLKAMEVSLAYLKGYFSTSQIYIVYIPSMITPYELADKHVYIYPRKKYGEIYLSSAVEENTTLIQKKVQEISESLDIGFINTTKRFKEVARSEYIHGPEDWGHFNQRGYEVLAEEIALHLTNDKK